MHKHRLLITAVTTILLFAACNRPTPSAQIIALDPVAITPISTIDPATPTTQPLRVEQTATPVPETATPILTATPFYTGLRSDTCGQLLPLLPSSTTAQTNSLTP
ncbi:MAG: hypothetical protein GY943_13535, partial [Chloroflexi bacterium]|nr:hypothetical protein [Chloroflexota bacterium]